MPLYNYSYKDYYAAWLWSHVRLLKCRSDAEKGEFSWASEKTELEMETGNGMWNWKWTSKRKWSSSYLASRAWLLVCCVELETLFLHKPSVYSVMLNICCLEIYDHENLHIQQLVIIILTLCQRRLLHSKNESMKSIP